MSALKAFREQLSKLQRLAQPYFLPVADGDGGSATEFFLLVLALLAVVAGSTLLLLTGAVALSGALIPKLRDAFLDPGDQWHQCGHQLCGPEY